LFLIFSEEGKEDKKKKATTNVQWNQDYYKCQMSHTKSLYPLEGYHNNGDGDGNENYINNNEGDEEDTTINYRQERVEEKH
jgi:hypothetical protein